MYYCNCDVIQVDYGDHSREFRRGDILDVPPGTLASMVRLRQAVVDDPMPPPGEQVELVTQTDWRETPVADLNLTEPIKVALGKAHLSTVMDVLEFGSVNETLTKITGIGESSEKAIQREIERLADASDNKT